MGAPQFLAALRRLKLTEDLVSELKVLQLGNVSSFLSSLSEGYILGLYRGYNIGIMEKKAEATILLVSIRCLADEM